MQTQIDLFFGDGTYLFKLPLPHIVELQRKTNLPIGKLYSRLLKGRFAIQQADGTAKPFGDPSLGEFSLADVIEPIRHGLMGGQQGRVNGEDVSVSAIRANELVETYCYPNRPLSEDWDLAVAIVSACIEGWTDPGDLKKKEDEISRSQTETQPSSTTQEPLETSPSAASRRSKRGRSRSSNTTRSASAGIRRTKGTKTP